MQHQEKEEKGFEEIVISLPTRHFDYLSQTISATDDLLTELTPTNQDQAEIIECISLNLEAIGQRIGKIFSVALAMQTQIELLQEDLRHAKEMRALAEENKEVYYHLLAKLSNEQKGGSDERAN